MILGKKHGTSHLPCTELLFSFCVNSQNYVSCELSDYVVVLYGVVDRIDVENEIYFV